MWKLNSLKAMSKPPVIAETALVVPEVGPTMIAAEIRPGSLGEAMPVTVNPAMSTSGSGEVVLMMFGTAMPTAVSMAKSMSILSLLSTMVGIAMMAAAAMVESMSSGDAESTTIGDAGPSSLVGAVRLWTIGEGAGESVDPDPVVPTVGTN
jgi:hypothetical protein